MKNDKVNEMQQTAAAIAAIGNGIACLSHFISAIYIFFFLFSFVVGFLAFFYYM